MNTFVKSIYLVQCYIKLPEVFPNGNLLFNYNLKPLDHCFLMISSSVTWKNPLKINFRRKMRFLFLKSFQTWQLVKVPQTETSIDHLSLFEILILIYKSLKDSRKDILKTVCYKVLLFIRHILQEGKMLEV